VDERLNQPAGTSQAKPAVSERYGLCPVLVHLLLFLIPILDTLGLQQALRGQNLVDEILLIPEHLAVLMLLLAGCSLLVRSCDELAGVSWI